MPLGNFLLCLHTHMPYVLFQDHGSHGANWLFEATAECYLPILNVLHRLKAQNIKPKWTINMTPILAEQFEHPFFKEGFQAYCQQKIKETIEDQRYFAHHRMPWGEELAIQWRDHFESVLKQFNELEDQSINKAYKYFQDEGSIEIITSACTHGYLPLLGTDESVYAQVKLGVETHKKYFGKPPKGIWLPECAYRPGYQWKCPVGFNDEQWIRKAVDHFLAENGIKYFFADAHMIGAGEPLEDPRSEYTKLEEHMARSRNVVPPPKLSNGCDHYKLSNKVRCFIRTPEVSKCLWAGNISYPADEYYLEFYRRQPGSFLRYWRISQDANIEAKLPYEPCRALKTLTQHAHDFISVIKNALIHNHKEHGKKGTVVAAYDTELFGHWWWEGVEFLYQTAILLHQDNEIRSLTGSEVLESDLIHDTIELPEGSWGDGGHHSTWLNEDTAWTWKLLYKAEHKMRDLVRDYVNDTTRPIVEQAARELLLAEASDWQFLIGRRTSENYAEWRFKNHIERFERLLKIIRKCYEKGSVSDLDRRFIRDVEKKDSIFKDIKLEWWLDLGDSHESKKKQLQGYTKSI